MKNQLCLNRQELLILLQMIEKFPKEFYDNLGATNLTMLDLYLKLGDMYDELDEAAIYDRH